MQSDPATSNDPFVLALDNVTVDDDGWYTCLVGNSVGYSHESFWITVVPRRTHTPASSSTRTRHHSLLMWFTSVNSYSSYTQSGGYGRAGVGNGKVIICVRYFRFVFLPTVLSVESLVQCVVCRLSSVCL